MLSNFLQHTTANQLQLNQPQINQQLFPGDNDVDMNNEDVFGGLENPILQQPLQPLQPPQPPQPPSQPQPPPQPQSSRRNPARNIGGRRYSNSRRPSNAGQSENKWCSTGRHHRPYINFIENGRTFQTCNNCRAAQRRNRANQHAANDAAQVLQQLEQQEVPLQNTILPGSLAPHLPHPPPPSLPPPPQQLDPLLNPAISPEDRNRLERVRARWTAIQLESCDGCEREWFDLDVQQAETGDNLCKACRKPSPLFHKNNNLYPGPGCPDLPPLTQIEEMLISPVHALIQVGY